MLPQGSRCQRMLPNRFLRWWGIELSHISHESTQGLKLAPFIRASERSYF